MDILVKTLNDILRKKCLESLLEEAYDLARE